MKLQEATCVMLARRFHHALCILAAGRHGAIALLGCVQEAVVGQSAASSAAGYGLSAPLLRQLGTSGIEVKNCVYL